MATRWCTMEDVQVDLARATGQRARAPLLHEGCLLHGESPPPRHTADEEECEELQLRYGATVGGASMVELPSPDLRGITSMLRMVQNYSSDDSIQNWTTTDEVIVISKQTPRSPKQDLAQQSEPAASESRSGLNPQAKDFVPKLSSQSERKTGLSEGVTTALQSYHLERNSDTVTTVNENRERGSVESITEEQRVEREELAAMLQTKIRASPPDCPRRQRERYAAIAGLLRLHSATPAPPAPTLLTPDFFRTQHAELPVPETSADGRGPTAIPDEREVRASISKVSAWLHAAPPSPAHAPAPAPAPAPVQPHLGPPRYRLRQGGAAPPSPQRPSRAIPADVSYVPSANALALSEQYAARVAGAPAPPPSLWERVERDLRAQDARRAAAAAEAAAADAEDNF